MINNRRNLSTKYQMIKTKRIRPNKTNGFKSKNSNSYVDVVLQRLANGSQLAIVALAIFGYFYTVLPVYQKALLDEDIAKKTLDLREMEDRIERAEELLEVKESALNRMTQQLNELKVVADNARQSLGKAKVEASAAKEHQIRTEQEAALLRGTVKLKYMQLLPKLLRDFQNITISKCRNLNSSAQTFTECVEKNVINSPSLNGFENDDKQLLIKSVTNKSSKIQTTLNQLDEDTAISVQQLETEIKEIQARCDALKSSDNYTDENNKVRIDLRCSIETMKPRGELNKMRLDNSLAKDKFLSEQLTEVIKEFYSIRKY